LLPTLRFQRLGGVALAHLDNDSGTSMNTIAAVPEHGAVFHGVRRYEMSESGMRERALTETLDF